MISRQYLQGKAIEIFKEANDASGKYMIVTTKERDAYAVYKKNVDLDAYSFVDIFTNAEDAVSAMDRMMNV